MMLFLSKIKINNNKPAAWQRPLYKVFTVTVRVQWDDESIVCAKPAWTWREGSVDSFYRLVKCNTNEDANWFVVILFCSCIWCLQTAHCPGVDRLLDAIRWSLSKSGQRKGTFSGPSALRYCTCMCKEPKSARFFLNQRDTLDNWRGKQQTCYSYTVVCGGCVWGCSSL